MTSVSEIADDRESCSVRIVGPALLLLVAACLFRLPFFFTAVLDWDESTFILMGQDLLDGQLPYTQLWDIKPPLAFAAYAVVIALFGPHIEAVRLAGALCVSAAGLAIWVGSRQMVGTVSAACLALAVMLGVGSVPSGQATLTEHFVIVPACWALVLLARPNLGYQGIALAGLLLSGATLIRTNIAYLVVAVALGLMIRPEVPTRGTRVRQLSALCAGGLPPLMLCVLPFWVTDNLDLLYRSTVTAPLAYATNQLSVPESVVRLIAPALRPRGLLILIILGLGMLGVAKTCWQLAKARRVSSLEYWCLVFVAGGTLSVVLSGGGYSHYLIQILPLYALAASSIMSVEYSGAAFRSQVAGAMLAAGLAVAFVPVAKGYLQIAERIRQEEPLRDGRALAVAAYLMKNNTSHEPVFLMEEHLAYWLTHAKPLTRMSTHPSTLTKASLIRAVEGNQASPLSEIKRVFDRAPRYVIKPVSPLYLNGVPEVSQWLDVELQKNYRKVANIEGLDVYRRRDEDPAEN